MKSLSFLTALFCLLSTQKSLAIEPQSPVSLCERFIEGPDRSKCEKRMIETKPDWYVASVCAQNFDDQLFYDCVDLAKAGSYSPKKLEDCTGDQLTDNARITCVRAARTTAAKAFQDSDSKAKAKTPKK